MMDTRRITVEYDLMPHGATLQSIIQAIRIWGAQVKGGSPASPRKTGLTLTGLTGYEPTNR